MMWIRRSRALALAGVPLLALTACSDLLQDDDAPPQRVVVNQVDEDRDYRVGEPVVLEAFVADAGGLGVGSVPVSWAVDTDGGTVVAEGDRTSGNGFLGATLNPGTRAGARRVWVEVGGIGAADTVNVVIAPDTVVGTVELTAAADTVVEGDDVILTIAGVADRYGNAYDLDATGSDGLPSPPSVTTLDPAVLELAGTGTSYVVTGLAPGTGRVVARVGGRADTVEIVVEKFIPPGSFRAVSGGYYFTCGLSPTGGAFCWGEGAFGKLGTGSDAPRAVPTAVEGLAEVEVTGMDAGDNHACAVTAVGDVWCWGDNTVGQLGDGSNTSSSVPVKAVRPAGVVFVDVGTGALHTCARTEAGGVYCWGDNSLGQVGNGDASGASSSIPVEVAGLAGTAFAELAVGGGHSCARTAAGATWCWGYNELGSAGTGTFDPIVAVPTPVQGGVAFASLGLGYMHSCGVTTGGTVHCWGDNSSGQLGNGGADPSAEPVAVSGALTAMGVAGGLFHTCAVASDGRAYCWGANGSGRLGTNNEDPSAVPVEAQSGTIRFGAVDLGLEHSCAVGTDNEAYCWGTNVSGELGNDRPGEASLRPTRVVSPLAPAASRAAGAVPARSSAVAARGARRPATCTASLPARLRARVCR